MRIEFSECPVCHKKGWYVENSTYNLTHYKLHRCKYCRADEKVDLYTRDRVHYVSAPNKGLQADGAILCGSCNMFNNYHASGCEYRIDLPRS